MIPANPDRRVVTVWSDVSCPTTALALHVLRARAADRGTPLLLDHRAHPAELVDRRPVPRAVVDAESAALAAGRPELGWRPWPGPADTYPVTMLLALEAVQAAKSPACGGLPGSAQLDAALRRALLVEGRCISLYPVVVDVARDCPLLNLSPLLDALTAGTGRARVMAQWATAVRAGVGGGPHLYTAGARAEHGVGTTVHWLAGPGVGRPEVRDEGDAWADRLLDAL
jgi:hypothetical protein